MSSSLYQLTRKAENDFREIIRASQSDFGNQAAIRYKRLILVALREIANDPKLQGHREFEGIAYLYHIRYSSKRASMDSIKVRNPRHFVVYRILKSGIIEITRILHERMDLPNRLREE